ncbi:hypothetical protein D3C78_1639390 [compost metagenome]
MDIGKIVFVTRLDHFGLGFAPQLLAIKSINGQAVELQTAQAICQLVVVGGDQAAFGTGQVFYRMK